MTDNLNEKRKSEEKKMKVEKKLEFRIEISLYHQIVTKKGKRFFGRIVFTFFFISVYLL